MTSFAWNGTRNLIWRWLAEIPSRFRRSTASTSTPHVEPQPTSVTSASAGPSSFGAGRCSGTVVILRPRLSTIFLRRTVSVYTSLMSTPSSSCSSVPATYRWPGTPGTARGEMPDAVSL